MPFHHGRVPDEHMPPHKRTGKWIQAVVESPKFRKGALTEKATHEHMKPLPFAHHVLGHPEDYDLRTRREAQFLVNIQRR